MRTNIKTIAAICLIALVTTGCVSTSEHQRVLMEAEESARNLRECRSSLAGTESNREMLAEANMLLTEQVEEIVAKRESLGELVAECEFAVRERDDEYREQAAALKERDDEYREQAAALKEIERELEARQQLLKPLLEQQKFQQELYMTVETLVLDLMVVFSAQIEEELVTVSSTPTSALLTINNKLLYKSYGTRLTGKGKRLLGKAADSFNRIGISSLHLEAFTDNIQPRKELKKVYPSNWDLSASRAASAAHYLTSEEGVPPEVVVASGHSENTPLADNAELEGRVINRRLVLSATPVVRSESPASDARQE